MVARVDDVMSRRSNGFLGRFSDLPRPYWLTWTASSVSNLGDGVFTFALLMLAARLSNDPMAIATVGACGSLPWLLIALPGGVVIDRLERRWLTVSANLIRMLAVGTLGALVALDTISIPVLCVFAAIVGSCEVIVDNATQAIVPALVPHAMLGRAVGWRVSSVTILNEFLGGPLGVALFVWAAWSPFVVNAIAFAVAALVLTTLRGSFRVQPSTSVTREESSFSGELLHGLKFLFSHRMLRLLAMLSATVSIGLYMGLGIVLLYVRDELGLPEGSYGVFSAIGISGGVLGAFVADFVIDQFGKPLAIKASLSVWAIGLAGIGLAQEPWHVALLSALVSFCVTVWNVTVSTLRQQITPPRLHGRIGAATTLFSGGAVPLGFLLGGLVGRATDLRTPFFLGSIVTAIAALVAVTQVTESKIGVSGYQYE